MIWELQAAGVRVGLASSSRNASLVLERARLTDLVATRVDGLVADRARLRSKPAPDLFLKCLDRLGGIEPAHAIVVEDAASGVFEDGRSSPERDRGMPARDVNRLEPCGHATVVTQDVLPFR